MASFTKEQALINLNGLIRKYNENKLDKGFASNESQISESLIKPFVNLVLGWDVTEPSEFKVQSSMGGKRSDMLVCLNGVTQFIIEAKALSHDIRKDYQYYQQAIQYAQYKEKKFAILTNFKYFIVLDAEIEKEPLKSEVAVIDIENFKNGDFDILWAFSKEVWQEKGENNEVLLKLKGKKKQKIDEQLLGDLKKWRLLLLNSLKSHPQKNKLDFHKDVGKIEEEVQKFIDRLVFICYCEDKQLMDFELKSILHDKEEKQWDKEWYALDRARKLFEVYRKKYNSDLFNEDWCDSFYFDDNTLVKILKDLRQPKDKLPYDFSIIEADILGKTYENFIGHVLTGEKKLKEKESKGKRKSEGIYYTPAYIVDYIVKNTVKEYIKGKSIASINKVKILDPACGSGSFLIKAFDALVEECEKIRKLNYEEKRGLMLNCIFGVDKDERAVDICKLNLSLKLAERGQKLPELYNNIKCGDSLIDDENIAGEDKAFNWNEKFKSIMENGGFDVVIGNPPYVSNWQLSENDRLMVEYLDKEYADVTLGHWDIYILFIKKGLDLLKSLGYLSFIVPSSFSKEKYGRDLRKTIIDNFRMVSLVDFSTESVFKDVARQYVVFVIQNNKPDNSVTQILNFKDFGFKESHKIPQKSFNDFHNFTFRTDLDKKCLSLLRRMSTNSIPIGEICCVNVGVVAHSKEGSSKKFTKDSVITNTRKEGFKKYIEGKDISRYSYSWKSLYMDYNSKMKYFHRPKFPELFESNKLIVRRVSGENNSLIAVYDENKFYSNDNLIVLIPWSEDIQELQSPETKYPIFKPYNHFSLKYILAVLNSALISFYFSKMIATGTLQGTYTGVYPEDIRSIPIQKVSQDNQLPFINLSDKMLSLNKKLQEIGDKNTLEKQKIEQEIKKTDNEIDELVYQLYGVTEEERKIIEESLR